MKRPPPQDRSVGSIAVHRDQKGNGVLSHITKVGWTFSADILADYELGQTTCAFFLSIRYHRLHPNYIYDRFRTLGRQRYKLRLVLVLVDSPNPEKSLLELTRISLVLDFTVILSWSNEEAGRYLETFKLFEHRSADAIRERPSGNAVERATGMLTAIPRVNKTDALNLVTSFGTVREILACRREDLELCVGFGTAKIDAFLAATTGPLAGAKPRGQKDEGRDEATPFA